MRRVSRKYRRARPAPGRDLSRRSRPCIEHDDLIDIVNCREPMGCNQSGAAAHQFFDCFHDRRFGRRIERRSGFVEQQNRRVLQKRSRDADALPLADAQMSASFADCAFVSVRQLPNKFICLRPARGFDNFFLGRIRPAISDVLAHGGGKKQRVLQDDRDLRAQRFFCDLANITAVERDEARGRIVKSRHQTQQTCSCRRRCRRRGRRSDWDRCEDRYRASTCRSSCVTEAHDSKCNRASCG